MVQLNVPVRISSKYPGVTTLAVPGDSGMNRTMASLCHVMNLVLDILMNR